MSGILGKIEVEALETLYPNRGNVDRIDEIQSPSFPLKLRKGMKKLKLSGEQEYLQSFTNAVV
jgi:hypothetical protein